MPISGIDKYRYNYVDTRLRAQKEFWPDFVRQWDEEQNGKRFRSETLSLTELWHLYVGGTPEDLTEEEEARGKKLPKKKDRGFDVIPIKAFELPGRFSDPGEYHHGKWGYLHFDQWLYARDQARKDLYWFGKEVFAMDFEPNVHQVTCNQFVQKDFDGVFDEGYSHESLKKAFNLQTRIPRVWVQTAEYQHRTLGDFGKYMPDPIEQSRIENLARTMILLDPRGFFKTFTNILDTVQWIINCPEVRILIMSGTYQLTEQFLKLAKSKFYLPRGMRPKTFHLLF